MRIQGGAVLSAEQAYAMGKAALQAGDAQRALLSFEQSLALSQRWVDAQNGRVVALARLGRTDEAISTARIAVAQGAQSAELHGNLALLLRGRGLHDEAAVHLARALQLDANNPVWQEPVPQVAAVTAPSAESPVTSLQTPAATAPGAGGTLRWLQQAPHVLSLTSSGELLAPALPLTLAAAPAVVAKAAEAPPSRPPMQASKPAPAASTHKAGAPANPAASPAPAPARSVLVLEQARVVTKAVEISNGHGQRGLAKEAAQGLRSVLHGPTRITNHAHFRVAQTQLQYRGVDDLQAARELALALGITAELVANPKLRPGTGVRLLLGQDVTHLPSLGGALAKSRQAAG